MPRSVRLFSVSMLILCCCVSVVFAAEQPQTNDLACDLNQMISAHHQNRNRDGSCDGDQDRDRNRDGSCQPELTTPDDRMVISDGQDRDQDRDKDQNCDGSC